MVNADVTVPWRICGHKNHDKTYPGSKVQHHALAAAMADANFRKRMSVNKAWRHGALGVRPRGNGSHGLFAQRNIPANTIVAIWGRGLAMHRCNRLEPRVKPFDLHHGVVLKTRGGGRSRSSSVSGGSSSGSLRGNGSSGKVALGRKVVDIASLAFRWLNNDYIPLTADGCELHYGAYLAQGSNHERNTIVLLARRRVVSTREQDQALEANIALVMTISDVAKGDELFCERERGSAIASMDWQLRPDAVTRSSWPIVGSGSWSQSTLDTRLTKRRRTSGAAQSGCGALVSPTRGSRREDATLLSRSASPPAITIAEARYAARVAKFTELLGWPIEPGLPVYWKDTRDNVLRGAIIEEVREESLVLNVIELGETATVVAREVTQRVSTVPFYEAVSLAYVWHHGIGSKRPRVF